MWTLGTKHSNIWTDFIPYLWMIGNESFFFSQIFGMLPDMPKLETRIPIFVIGYFNTIIIIQLSLTQSWKECCLKMYFFPNVTLCRFKYFLGGFTCFPQHWNSQNWQKEFTCEEEKKYRNACTANGHSSWWTWSKVEIFASRWHSSESCLFKRGEHKFKGNYFDTCHKWLTC